MPHVGVQRFGARDHEKHGAHDRQRDARMRREQRYRVTRRYGDEHFGRSHDLASAEHGERAEPQHHDGAEQSPDPRCAAVLQREQRDQDAERDRQDHALEHGIDQ